MKKKIFSQITLLILLISLVLPNKVNAITKIEWYTSMGNFEAELYEELVPITANNFIDLIDTNYYDGLIFHRVIADFMIQDGHRDGGPGYTIPDEFTPELRHDTPGVISMANAGPNTGGAEYFITVVPTAWLDDVHSIFGHVTTGMDVVNAISVVPTDANDKPLTDVVIDSIRVLDLQVVGSIEDILMEDTATQDINLGDYFNSMSDKTITYTVESSDENVVTAKESGNILTVTKGSQTGMSTISITGNTDNIHFETMSFVVGSFLPVPIAGFGKCLSFDGNNDYIDAGNNAILNGFTNFSTSFWLKLNQKDINQGIISKGLTASNGWYADISANNKIKFSLKSESGVVRKVYSTSTLNSDEWYHLDLTYNGQNLRIFINGELDNEKAYSTVSYLAHDEVANLTIGKSSTANLNGVIDNLYIWDKVLTYNEINSNMSKAINTNMSNLLGAWLFDENFGFETVDETGNNISELKNMSNLTHEISTVPINFKVIPNTIFSGVLPANDLDNNSQFVIVQDPSSGTLSLINDVSGEFSFSPATDFEGDLSFEYKIYDGVEYYSDIITANLNVSETNSINDTQNLAENTVLYQNYPNPFNPVTTIKYYNGIACRVELTVYNVKGEMIKVLVNNFVSKGNQSVSFDAIKLNSGIYYYTLESGNQKITKKMLLVK